jgi:hypothetical protein
MKVAILNSPAFVLFVFAGVVMAGGFWGYSVSSFDKGGSFPWLLLLSVCVICLGGIVASISLVVGLVGILQSWLRTKHTT